MNARCGVWPAAGAATQSSSGDLLQSSCRRCRFSTGGFSGGWETHCWGLLLTAKVFLKFTFTQLQYMMLCLCLTPPQSIVLCECRWAETHNPSGILDFCGSVSFLLGRQQRKQKLKQLFHFSAAVFRLFSFHRHYLRFTANIWASNPLYWLRLTSVILLLFPVVSIPRSITSSMLPDCYEVHAGGSIPAQHPYRLAII